VAAGSAGDERLAERMQFRAGVPQAVSGRGLSVRAGQLVLGLALWGLAIALMIRSELGLGPWDAFHVGLHLQAGLSVGVANILTGTVIVALTLAMRVRPGLAIVLNTLLIGVFVDLLLPATPAASGPALAVAYFAAALLLAGLATGMYIGAGFGQGPRDALMLALHERTGWSVQRARTALEAGVLAAGWLMGARIGMGTVLYALARGRVAPGGLGGSAPPPPRGGGGGGGGLRRAA
jgi:uncharacterized membrane protein YczE